MRGTGGSGLRWVENRSGATNRMGIGVRYQTPEYLKGTTSIFFTNFPNECGEGDMWRIFVKMGNSKGGVHCKKER